ncbi:MAG TPA: MaoC/PaaZ C-terminal domain-containing protein [Actinomycetes bacterium]|nr:MaoC/PaaZ C-terminal domain-containing protein [Actinomycetes bacterium]
MSTTAATKTTRPPLLEGARQLTVTLDAERPITGAPVPVTPSESVVDVRSADVSRRRSYQMRYYSTAIRSVLRRHRLVVPVERPTYRTAVRVSPRLQQQWMELFDVPPGAEASLTYFTTSGTSLFMRMLADLGINFRHLLHLASAMQFLADADPGPASGIHQEISGRLASVSVVGDSRVCLVVQHELTAPPGRQLQRNRETFMIGGVDPTVMDELRAISTPPAVDLRGITTRKPRLDGRPNVHRAQLAIPRDAGLRYGSVSGDLNVVHTTRLAARLFGFRGAFLQGLGTANHVLSDIARHTPGRLDAFEVTFARPLYVGQTAELTRDRTTFEVTDQRKHLVAYGTYRVAT